MIALLCSIFFYAAEASLSAQIPIVPMVVYQSQIQDYSVSQEMMRRGQEKFAPKFDREFYVRHWQLHMHDQVKQAQILTRSQQPFSAFNKFISQQALQNKTGNRQLYGYGILLVFGFLLVMQRKEGKQQQQQSSFEEEEYELAATKH